jgi:lipoprotein-anchoring transpeptidase ErfK/SrfK
MLWLLLPAAALAQEPEPAAPSPGMLRLTVTGAYRVGADQLAFVGEKLTIRGTVDPVVAGEQVEVTVKRARKVVRRKTVTVDQDGFGVAYRSSRRGTLRIVARHAATTAQVEMKAAPVEVELVRPSVHRGGGGAVVRFLQQRLSALHYRSPRSGRYDDRTGLAVLAYRKVSRMRRTTSADRRILVRLAAGRGTFHPRYPTAGKHVEADLSRQVIALINPGGEVYKIIHTSSGKPSTPTVLGTFHFYLKTPGTNVKRMLDANYFIRGYAIHGYPEVPPYAASHGCLRIPNADAAFVYRWISIGDRIDVYALCVRR